MCFFCKNKQRKEAESFFLDFLEGRITPKNFFREYSNNIVLRKVLVNDKKRWKKTYVLNGVKMTHYGKGPYDKIFKFNPDTLLEVCDIEKLHDIYELYVVINRYFFNRNIEVKCKIKEVEKYLLLQKMVPKYLDLEDGEYLESIFNLTNKKNSQTERIREGKEIIKNLYQYDTKPPKWIHGSEWPIDKDGPMVFSYQKNETGRSLYYFYNKSNFKQVVVEQFE